MTLKPTLLLKMAAFIITLSFSIPASAQTYSCLITGTVIDRNSDTLYLVKASDTYQGNKQPIPIDHKKFSYRFTVKQTEAYELIFKDELDKHAYDPVIFFPVTGVVNFVLYPQKDVVKDQVTGGALNDEYYKFIIAYFGMFKDRLKALVTIRDSRERNNIYYTQTRDSLIDIVNHTDHDKIDQSVWRKLKELETSGDEFTPQGKALKVGFDSIYKERYKWKYRHIQDYASIASYYLMLEDVYMAKENKFVADEIKATYPLLAHKYPKHSYTTIIGNELNIIQPGFPVIDFEAPDINGHIYRLSNLAKGKITLLDMWGSWCGPCIANSRTMRPVYDKFKDKGFIIIGVAREFKNTHAMENRLAKEKFPWINLVELDDQHSIWNKYGISAAAGMMILIDKDGKILALNPSANELTSILSRRL